MRSGRGQDNSVKVGGTTMRKKEAGQALPLVLILLLFGGLTVPPLLAYISTALKSGSAVERRVQELYAADSGIEDAVYKIDSGTAADMTYYVDNQSPLGTPDIINGKQVQVTIQKRWVLEGLEDIKNGTMPHAEWTVGSRPISGDTYAVDATYDGSAGGMKGGRGG